MRRRPVTQSLPSSLTSYLPTRRPFTTKTYLMQAVTTLTMVLQQKGGGNKIPQSVKDFFIDAVGKGEFNQDLVNKLSGEEDWEMNYGFMIDRYEIKHKAEISIRQFVKASQKKKK